MHDLISRQAAIDALEAKKDKSANGDIGCFYNTIIQNNIDALNGLPSAQPQWIPCSERLPGEDDYKPCIECLDGAVWYFTENGTMGIGYYYESTKEWSTTNDLKTDGKVIAWKPLPPAFKPKEDN